MKDNTTSGFHEGMEASMAEGEVTVAKALHEVAAGKMKFWHSDYFAVSDMYVGKSMIDSFVRFKVVGLVGVIRFETSDGINITVSSGNRNICKFNNRFPLQNRESSTDELWDMGSMKHTDIGTIGARKEYRFRMGDGVVTLAVLNTDQVECSKPNNSGQRHYIEMMLHYSPSEEEE